MDTERDWQSGKSLAESNQIMLENEIGTDVTFVFPEGQQKVKAHKYVLMSRSHVFYVMFSTSLRESGKDIEIPDIEPPIFKELLKFLYYDGVTISAENALHLLYSAQKYEVEVLKARCLDFLKNNLDVNTVGLILDQAVFYNEVKLFRTCLNFLSNHSIRCLKRLNEYHISKETLELIIDCESLWVDEIFVFRACLAWSRVECEKKGLPVNTDNQRKVLGSILKKIRFCSMSNEEVASQVSPSGMLTVQEEVQIFRFIGTPSQTRAPFPDKERIPLHAMLPNELSKDPGGNMRRLLNITNESFHIYLTCCRQFKLLGFFFTKTGTYEIRLNDDVCEDFTVSEVDVNMYLSKPLPCDKGYAMDIREKKVDPKAHIRNETYSFSCKTRLNKVDNAVVTCSVTRYDLLPPPFNALIMAL